MISKGASGAVKSSTSDQRRAGNQPAVDADAPSIRGANRRGGKSNLGYAISGRDDPGIGYRKQPRFPTKAAMLRKRARNEHAAAEGKIQAGIDAAFLSSTKASKELEELRAKAYSGKPSSPTRTDLLEKRRMAVVEDTRKMRERQVVEHRASMAAMLARPQTVPVNLPSSRESARQRVRAHQRRNNPPVMPSDDPFKTTTTSLHKLQQARAARQALATASSAEIRIGMEDPDRPRLNKFPPALLKRWSDIVIEFQQVERKMDRERMGTDGSDGANGGGGGSTGSANLSIADWAPLYSCFTKDNIFVEPIYGQKGKPEKSENEQVLRPMMRSSSGRVLPLMSRMERISRFRQAHSSRGGRYQQQSQMSNANTNFTRSAASMSSEKIQFESPEAQADSAPGRPRTAQRRLEL